MRNKGVTLVELLIVIVVLGIIAGFTTVQVTKIIDNTAEKVDNSNALFLAEKITQAYNDGVLTISGSKLYNNESNRGYSGTGSWFFDDMSGYIENQIVPQAREAHNKHNKAGDLYKFRFDVSGNTVTIYYFDTNKDKVNLVDFILN